MNKKEFIERVARNNGRPKCETKYWVDMIFDELRDCMLDSIDVSLYGFGKFVHKVRKGRTYTPPIGDPVDVDQVIRVKFIPSVFIEDAIRDGLDSNEFQERMEIIRSLKRGEYVPGYSLSWAKLKHKKKKSEED